MSWLSWLFGGGKAASKIVDGVLAAADKLVYTEEERAEMRAKAREWFLKYLQATQPQNAARRLIAITVSALWALLVVAALIAQVLGAQDIADYALRLMRDVVQTPFGLILGFYFAAHVVRAAKGQ